VKIKKKFETFLFYYKKGKNATQVTKKIYDVYRYNAISVRVEQNWFKRFQSIGNFDVKDTPLSGQPIIGKIDEIMKKVTEQDQHISSR